MAVAVFDLAYLFLDAKPSERLHFQMIPDTLTISKSAEWGSTEVVGRGEPYRAYRASSPRNIAFTMRFFASVDAGDNGNAFDDVRRKADWLEALVYPDNATGFPPLTRLFFGNTLQSLCIVKSVSIVFDGPWAFERDVGQPGANEFVSDILPMHATATLSLDEINSTPPTATLVRDGILTRRGLTPSP